MGIGKLFGKLKAEKRKDSKLENVPIIHLDEDYGNNIKRIIVGEIITEENKERYGDRELYKEIYDAKNYTKIGAGPVGTMGFLNYRLICDDGEKCLYIKDVFVPKKYREKGVGKALVGEAEKIARENGIKRLWTLVGESDGNVYPFFEKLGYNEQSRCCTVIKAEKII